MVGKGEIEVTYKASLSVTQRYAYDSAFVLFAKELELHSDNKRGANRGEVETLAIAHALGADYFVSDDRDAGIAAMKSRIDINILNYGDIISHIKEHSEGLGINRKTARQMFLYQVSEKHASDQSSSKKLSGFRERLKIIFDSKWPVK